VRRLTPRVVPRSGLPTARSAVRRAAGIQTPRRRRKPVSGDDSPAGGAPVGSPYDDPSRDVGEGPDGMTKMQSWLVGISVLFGIYVASASCGTADVQPVEHRCHICQEFTSGGNP
jgi:hypothetical protein